MARERDAGLVGRSCEPGREVHGITRDALTGKVAVHFEHERQSGGERLPQRGDATRLAPPSISVPLS